MAKNPPPGAYSPGTVLTVGSHTAIVLSYFSEGGFAHVYKVEISPKENNTSIACMKRVAVPDKQSLNTLRAEVDSMKRLSGNKHIVSYIDSHAARMPTGTGYEVFVLMELCENKGLIDFMNTRLTNRLTEAEILRIMGEVTEGVAVMHALSPPLIHRDIKIENVLISGNGDYKLCDFGSASPVLRPPRNAEEFAVLQNDIMKNTTPQYRAPEMIDLYRGLPIDEKSDVWALGIFLYKLCYYITPFESQGELAILHSKFQFHDRPIYSERLKNLISVLLREDPRRRPNAYQTLEEVCKMRNIAIPVPDYTKKEQIKSTQQLKYLSKLNDNPQSQITPNLATKKLNQFPLYNNLPKSTPNLNSLNNIKTPSQSLSRSESPEKDPFQNISSHQKLDNAPIKPPRPSSNFNDLSRSMSNLAIEPSELQIPIKPKYIDSVTQTEPQLPQRPKPKPKPRPQSMYVYSNPTSDNHEHLKQRVKMDLASNTNAIELSPGDGNHISSNRDFLKSLEQQDSGKSWIQQTTGGSIKSLRRISTGNKKRNGLMSQLTGKFSRSNSRSNSRASSIHESQEIYPTNSGSIKYRSSSESIEEEVRYDEPAKQLTRSNSIQRRVAQLLNRSNDPPIIKTAKGYGNKQVVSNDSISAEVDSDGFKKPMLIKTSISSRKSSGTPHTPPLTAQSTTSTVTKSPVVKITPSTTTKKLPPLKPKKPEHLKSPQIPKKPEYLKSGTKANERKNDISARKVSNESNIIADFDDYEKEFNEKYPVAF
ncbi:hypothetical protein WICMUC_004890 [Wickerhamomyces mucosus]|uniref:non-specific serine/threonine protein kinase n=1 Tax=Wickerhamomyces mucosus TaxID=1378264 RepID=A0A9P8T8Z4_9ASCO|nr:hypothetical protein WICMUC_004890 [Wickerhamomyces mucosus]